jgi:hypothetical protein
MARKRSGSDMGIDAVGGDVLPSEETATKSATLDNLRALERGRLGKEPLDPLDRTRCQRTSVAGAAMKQDHRARGIA